MTGAFSLTISMYKHAESQSPSSPTCMIRFLAGTASDSASTPYSERARGSRCTNKMRLSRCCEGSAQISDTREDGALQVGITTTTVISLIICFLTSLYRGLSQDQSRRPTENVRVKIASHFLRYKPRDSTIMPMSNGSSGLVILRT